MMSKTAHLAEVLAVCTVFTATIARAQPSLDVLGLDGRKATVAFDDDLVLIADTRNGTPLLADSGPRQIVVPQDQRAARWVRQPARLEVRQLQ